MYRFLVGLACWSVVTSTPAVYCMDRKEIVNNMNALLMNPGWKMIDVAIKDPGTNIVVHSKVLCEHCQSELPVTERNVHLKLRIMSLVLSCKYAAIVWWSVEMIRLILVEQQQKKTMAAFKWHYFWATVQRVNNIRPMLIDMFGAIECVNHMDVAITVSRFQYDLWILITHMDAIYENHNFLMKPLLDTDMTPNLLNNIFDSLNTSFIAYSETMSGFLHDFCIVEVTPNRETFESMYTNSKPLFKHQMNLSEFLSSVLEITTRDNIQNFYHGLGFLRNPIITHKTLMVPTTKP